VISDAVLRERAQLPEEAAITIQTTATDRSGKLNANEALLLAAKKERKGLTF